MRLTECYNTEWYPVFCRIDSDDVIKVADFGLSKSTYEKLYFRQDKSEDTKLPIKWLAIECMEDAIFSEKSDVVSQKHTPLSNDIEISFIQYFL